MNFGQDTRHSAAPAQHGSSTHTQWGASVRMLLAYAGSASTGSFADYGLQVASSRVACCVSRLLNLPASAEAGGAEAGSRGGAGGPAGCGCEAHPGDKQAAGRGAPAACYGEVQRHQLSTHTFLQGHCEQSHPIDS